MKKTTSKTKKPQTTNATTSEDAAPAKEGGSHPGKRILSLAIDPTLHRQLSLCARCEGISVTQLVTDAVSKNLKSRIAAALQALQSDLDE